MIAAIALSGVKEPTVLRRLMKTASHSEPRRRKMLSLKTRDRAVAHILDVSLRP